MKGINHLVLAGHDLEAMRSHYAALGFTVAPRGQHPFGTGNSVIALRGSFLELLAVTAPQNVPEHRPGHFSFAAFNCEYLKRHDGFSMLVLDSTDARADIDKTLAEYGIARPDQLSNVLKYSMACPAIPTCGLAISESERILPAIIDELEDELKRLGLEDEKLSIRMTGCPNGCARPY